MGGRYKRSESKSILGYTASFNSAWNTGDPVSDKHNEMKVSKNKKEKVRKTKKGEHKGRKRNRKALAVVKQNKKETSNSEEIKKKG